MARRCLSTSNIVMSSNESNDGKVPRRGRLLPALPDIWSRREIAASPASLQDERRFIRAQLRRGDCIPCSPRRATTTHSLSAGSLCGRTNPRGRIGAANHFIGSVKSLRQRPEHPAGPKSACLSRPRIRLSTARFDRRDSPARKMRKKGRIWPLFGSTYEIILMGWRRECPP